MKHYSQRDPAWCDERLGYDSNETIGTAGCLLTATAMVLTEYGMPVTPYQLNQKLRDVGGFTGALMYISGPSLIYSVSSKVIPGDSNLSDLLSQGNLPILHIGDHWIVVIGSSDGHYLIYDPWTFGAEISSLEMYSDRGPISDIYLIEKASQVELPKEEPKVQEPEKKYEPVLYGDKVVVIENGLRLRFTPSVSQPEATMLFAGRELHSAGNPIPDGDITWQPVIMYVAINYKNNRYLKAVK